MQEIKGAPENPPPNSLLEKIQKFYIENFDPGNPKMPCAVCSQCINTLRRNPEKLPDPSDYSQLEFPSRAQLRELKISNLDEMTGCTCSLCIIGRQSGAQFSPTKSPVHKIARGRPAYLPQTLPLRRPVTICARCEQVLGKGIPHPQNCSIQDLRENRQAKQEQDPVGYEKSAAKLIKKKIGESSGDSIQLTNTAGKPLTLPKPDKASVTKALFVDIPVPKKFLGKWLHRLI